MMVKEHNKESFIVRNITEKSIYFSKKHELYDVLEVLLIERGKLNRFFDRMIETDFTTNDWLIYKEMLNEYERIEHLIRCAKTRLNSL